MTNKKLKSSPNLIGISGKIGAGWGKDLVGIIIQHLTDNYTNDISLIAYNIKQGKEATDLWKIKKFADKLKDIVCLLIDCTREQLEDQEFKNKELGEEWWFYGYGDLENKIYTVKIPYLESKDKSKVYDKYLIKLTPRLLLQLLGTECGRNIIHPNIWVNSLFADYSGIWTTEKGKHDPIQEYPNWIITDMRFPNELEAIKQRNGVTIRVNRPCEECGVLEGHKMVAHKNKPSIHESETALDSVEFDFTINNSGSIEDLIEKVKTILIELKVI